MQKEIEKYAVFTLTQMNKYLYEVLSAYKATEFEERNIVIYMASTMCFTKY